MDACKVMGTGSSATLSCGQPITMASSTLCTAITGIGQVCNFLDKDFLSLDSAHGRLYAWSDGRLGLPQPFEAHVNG